MKVMAKGPSPLNGTPDQWLMTGPLKAPLIIVVVLTALASAA